MLISFLISFFVGLAINYFLLVLLRKFQINQIIRKEGPASHKAKTGIPTMGGLGIIITTIIILLCYHIPSSYNLSLLFLLIGFGLIGFIDDFLKIYYKKNKGLPGRYKLLLQFLVSLVFAYVLISVGHYEYIEPFWKLLGIVNPIIYLIFIVFVLVGSSNALNLTDGLDGLAGGVSTIILITYGFICLNLGLIDAALFCFVLAAVCLSFLFFNFKPAVIFMGDVGSLALGGVIGGIAILTHTLLPLCIIAIVPILEALSVIIQVSYFKITKGKRIFKMTPIHHHFELLGWPEVKVVFRFWLVTIISSIVGYLLI